MTAKTWIFEFEQNDPERIAALQQKLREEFPDWTCAQTTLQSERRADSKALDPVAVIALVLSIPPAIEASWDLVTRMKIKQRIDSLLAWAKQRPGINSSLGQSRVPLEQATTSELVEALHETIVGEHKGEA